MSFGTHNEVGDVQGRQERMNVTIRAAAEGFGLGAGISGIAGYMLRSRPAIRNLPLPTKTAIVAASGVMLGVVFGDKAGLEYEEKQRTDEGAAVERQAQLRLDREWGSLSAKDKVITYCKDNRLKVVLSSWAASMGLSWLYIQSQPMTMAQKIVQARVWAQGLTVASMLGMAAISTIPLAGDKFIADEKKQSDDSWMAIAAKTEQEMKEHGQEVYLNHQKAEEKSEDKREGKPEEKSN